jgi:hypothetical protein
MPAIAEPVSKSLLFDQQSRQLDLLQDAASQLARRPSNEEAISLLEQMIRICVHAPQMWRDLWEWAREQEQTGRIVNRPMAGKVLRDQLCRWMTLLDVMHENAVACEGAGHPIRGAEELLKAADELGAIGQEVNQTWPIEELPEPHAPTGLSYAELRSAGDRFPAASDWPDEDFDTP